MDVIEIDKLYNKNKVKLTLTAEVPIEVYNLTLTLFDDAHYNGLQGLGLEEYIGALLMAYVCLLLAKGGNKLSRFMKKNYMITYKSKISYIQNEPPSHPYNSSSYCE